MSSFVTSPVISPILSIHFLMSVDNRSPDKLLSIPNVKEFIDSKASFNALKCLELLIIVFTLVSRELIDSVSTFFSLLTLILSMADISIKPSFLIFLKAFRHCFLNQFYFLQVIFSNHFS